MGFWVDQAHCLHAFLVHYRISLLLLKPPFDYAKDELDWHVFRRVRSVE